MQVSTYLKPDLVLGRGPTTSNANLLKGTVITGKGTNGALLWSFLAAFWHCGHDVQRLLMSTLRPGQVKCYLTLAVVLFTPK